MKNIELAKLGGVHFNTTTKLRKAVGINKQEKTQRKLCSIELMDNFKVEE
jgi:hypothetical protein